MLDRIHYSSRIKWTEKAFNGKYPVRVPEYMVDPTYARTGLFDNYEVPRIESMAALLRPDDVLFDIGSETGWMTALFGRHFVRPENVCMFEPSDVQWPTIKAIWEANSLTTPRSTWAGFVADRDFTPEICHFKVGYVDGWPLVAQTPFLNEQNQFRGFRERGHVDIPAITIDTFVRDRGIIPTAITVDIEGAEFLAMRGAYRTLRAYHPKIWMSIHMHPGDGFTGDTQKLDNHIIGPLLYDYHSTRRDLLEYMADFDYEATYLGYDHEEHWIFQKRKDA